MSNPVAKKTKHASTEDPRRVEGVRSDQRHPVKDNGPTREQVAHRAYFIWLDKGKPADEDLACWCEAEAELRARRPA